jgi:glycolate oxidase iron-sulfur subunit
MDLGIDPDDLATCVACGLCLPHCPTYRVTGEEALSPRGRVAAMRQVQDAGAPPDASFVRSLETCVQCRGCETACPSGVPFGRLIGPARQTMVENPSFRRPSALRFRVRDASTRVALRSLRWHRLVLAGSTVLAAAQRLRLVPGRLSRRLGLPARLPLRRPRLRPTGRDVWLFTGCVMDAWMRDVHADAVRVVTAAGAGVALPPAGA